MFGDGKQLASALREANRPDEIVIEKRLRRAAWLMFAVVLFSTGIMIKSVPVYFAELGAFLAIVGWVGVLSYRLKQVTPLVFVRPILIGTALNWAFMTVLWMNLWMVGGMGYMPVWSRTPLQARIESRLPEVEKESDLARSVENALWRAKDKRAALKSLGLLESPEYARALVQSDPNTLESALEWRSVPIDDAAATWRAADSETSSLIDHWSTELLAFKAWDRISALQRLGSEVSVIGSGFALLTLSLWGASLIGALLGQMGGRARRRDAARRKGGYV
jgi:hypothetical protein